MVYADYAFYKGTFMGKAIPEEDFPRLAQRASAFLDYYTIGKAKDNAELEDVKLACCAIAEQQQAIEKAQALALAGMDASMATGGTVQSETVGSWSRTYGSNGWSTAWETSGAIQSALAQVARVYLAHTGLLYRGGRCW